MQLKAVVWKELKDLSRDRKTLFTAVFLPAFMLPLMAQLLAFALRTVPLTVVIVNQDKGAEVPLLSFQPLLPLESQKINLGDQVVKVINETVKKINPSTRVVVVKSLENVKNYDVMVIIPEDFSIKLLTVDPTKFNVTDVIVYYKASSKGVGVGTTTVYQSIIQALRTISSQIAAQRAQVLLACCNATGATPEAVLNPLRVRTQYISPTGETISKVQLGKLMSSKLLLFSVFYVSAPVLAFVSDSVAGEKERKTLETLLASPVKRRNIVLGKFSATLVLGLIAAVADVVGLILYIQTLNSQIADMVALGVEKGIITSLTIDLPTVALHGVVMLMVVASTAAMLMPVAALTDSVRSAQSLGGVIQMVPLLIILYSMYADINTIPMPWKALVFLIPHTYAVMAIDQALKGALIESAGSVGAMILATGILLWITIKIFESEVLVTSSFKFGKKR